MELVKTGEGRQLHGLQGAYDKLFVGKKGDRIIISGYYKTENAAGIERLGLGEYTNYGWKEYQTETIRIEDEIIEDGIWHYFCKEERLEEDIEGAIIWGGPNWNYSEEAGELWLNGINWRIIKAEDEKGGDIHKRKWAEGEQTIEYFKENGVEIADNKFKVNKNGKYTIYVEDFLGNSRIKTIEITNIDDIAPKGEAPTGKAWANKIEITCNQTDSESGINEESVQYRIRQVGEEEWSNWQESNVFRKLKIETEYELQTKAQDKVGNETESEIGRISTTKIPGGDEIIITPSEDDWTNENIEVEITWPEGTEDLNKKYSTDGGETWEDYEGPITVEENTEIIAKLEDEQGQEGEEARKEITNIDKANPGTEAPSATSTTSRIIITCNQTDNESGINEESIQYRIRKVGEQEWGEWQGSNVFTNLTKNTEYEVQTKVQDNAGNETESETSTIRTKDIQGGLENIKIIPNETEWTNQNIEVEIQYPEEIEGLKKEYSINGTDWYEYVEPIIIETNTTVYARLIDEIGQTGEIASMEIANIDKTNPGTEAPSLTSTTNGIEVTCNQTDSESGINETTKQYRIRKTGAEEWGAWQSTNTFTGLKQSTEYEVQTKVADNAGNEAESEIGKISTIKIPGGAEIIITPSEDDWTNQDIEVEITWPEGTEESRQKI